MVKEVPTSNNGNCREEEFYRYHSIITVCFVTLNKGFTRGWADCTAKSSAALSV